MSACQTGLGKVFDVGNTGLARAWHSAGAANVVMSLWNVHDDATRLLMTKFIEFAKQMPPDMALQKAMQEARRNNQYFRPVYWAGFNVFGAP
jgi:CHAT domain-containing protein